MLAGYCQARVKRQSSGCFSLAYQSAISRHLDTVAMAGGPSTTYGWHPSAQGQRLREIWNKAPGGATLSKFAHEYKAGGQTAWQDSVVVTGIHPTRINFIGSA